MSNLYALPKHVLHLLPQGGQLELSEAVSLTNGK